VAVAVTARRQSNTSQTPIAKRAGLRPRKQWKKQEERPIRDGKSTAKIAAPVVNITYPSIVRRAALTRVRAVLFLD